MERFAPTLKTGNVFDILNTGFESATTYFINWETITKKDNTAIRDSERKIFLRELVKPIIET